MTTRRKLLAGMTGIVACAPALVRAGSMPRASNPLGAQVKPNFRLPVLDQGPTCFYDPDASGSSGAGTYGNPFTTIAEIQAALSDSQPGQRLGIKRGSYTRGTLALGVAGVAGNPFHIVAYGDAQALPVFSGETVRMSWANYEDDTRIWQIFNIPLAVDVYDTGYVPPGQVGSRLLFVTGADLPSKITAIENYIAAPVAGTAGVFAYDGTTIYAWFVDQTTQANPNLGQVVTADATQAIYLSNGNVAAGGNVIIYEIAAYFARNNALQYTATSSATSIDGIQILKCEAAYTGAQGGAGANLGQDAITVYGHNQSVLATHVVVKGNYCHDCQNNAVELAYTSGAKVESNVAVNICGNSIVELWSNNTNSKVLFNRGYGDVNYFLKQNRGHGGGVWATNYSDGGGVNTNTQYNGGHLVAFNYIQDFQKHAIDNSSHNNTYLNNTGICENIMTAGDFMACQGNDSTVTGVTFFNNLFIENVVVSKTVCFSETVGAATPLPTSDYNGYFFAGRPVSGYASINGAVFSNLSAWNTTTGQDTHSHGLYVSGQGFGYQTDPSTLSGFAMTNYWTGSNMDYTLSNSFVQRIGTSIVRYQITEDVDGNPIPNRRHPDFGCKQFGGPLIHGN